MNELCLKNPEREMSKEKNDRYGMLFERSNDAIFIVDKNSSRFLDANKKAEILTEKSSDELREMTTVELLPKGAETRHKALLDSTDSFHIGEVDYERPDGKILTVSLDIVPFKHNQVLGIARDITEYKLAQKELKEREEMFNIVLENFPGIVFWKDAKLHYLGCNQSFAIGAGFSKPSDIKGKTDFDLHWGSTDGEKYRGDDFDLFKNNKPMLHYIETMHQADGNIKYFDTSKIPLHDSSGNTIGLLGVSNDITERICVDEALRKSEMFLKETQAIARIGSYSMDIHSGKWFSSEILDNILGIDASFDKSIEGWASIIHPEWREVMKKYLIEDVIINKANFDKKYKIIRQNDREIRWVHEIGKYKYDANNNTLALIGTIRDITDSKNAEQELVIAKEKAEESDRLKSAFLTNISHEIRTPMNGILGFAELLKEPKLSGEEQSEYIGMIEKSGARMINIINAVIAISKIESKQVGLSLNDVNIYEHMNTIFDIYRPEILQKGLKMEINIPIVNRYLIIKTDPKKLDTILMNLMNNAIKFTDSGTINFGFSEKSDEIEFFVKDTGIGIKKDQVKTIFEKFRQGDESLNRDYEGAGLGLSIAETYVKLLGGNIRVESEYGKGSTFYFTIKR